jgi:membrane associated rhomboid family serine protease
MSKREWRRLGSEFRRQTRVLAYLAGAMILAEGVDQFLLGGALDQFGIAPRRLVGLRGIVLAPLLHGGFAHLAANLLPLITFGWLVMLRRTEEIFPVTAIVVVLGGLGVWLFGRDHAIHLGASGLIFGYFGFLLLRGWFERSLGSLAFSIVIGLLYGGMVWGVLPSSPYISWEAHLFGFAAGILAARLIARRR